MSRQFEKAFHFSEIRMMDLLRTPFMLTSPELYLPSIMYEKLYYIIFNTSNTPEFFRNVIYYI